MENENLFLTQSPEKNLVSGFLCKQMSSHSKNSTSGNSLEDICFHEGCVCVCVMEEGGMGTETERDRERHREERFHTME